MLQVMLKSGNIICNHVLVRTDNDFKIRHRVEGNAST